MKNYFALKLMLFVCLFFMLFACSTTKDYKVVKPAFYYWKTRMNFYRGEEKTLDSLSIKKMYVRFFDVSYNEVQAAIPIAPLEHDLEYFNRPIYDKTLKAYLPHTSFEIVPTVFIVNRVFEKINEQQTKELAHKIYTKLFNEINKFNRENVFVKELQMDCDWTATTKEHYFLFLTTLKQIAFDKSKLNISATIRLHQYKNFAKTGVPPTDKGMLMFYNLTDLRKPTAKNSILDISEMKKYLINETYPLPIDAALPLFRWSVLFRGEECLQVFDELAYLREGKISFLKEIAANRYEAQTDTVYQNFYFREGDIVKVEEVNNAILLEAVDLLKTQKYSQDTLTISLFHFDRDIVSHYTVPVLKDVFKKLD